MIKHLASVLVMMLLSTHASKAENQTFSKLLTQIIDEIEGKDETAKAVTVNRIINRYQYIDDHQLYRSRDYWAQPEEFLANRGGDCEDFAILKLTLLQLIGIDSTLVNFRKNGENHVAVVAIADKKLLLLDLENQENVLNKRNVKNYRFFRLKEASVHQNSAFNNTPQLHIRNGLPSL